MRMNFEVTSESFGSSFLVFLINKTIVSKFGSDVWQDPQGSPCLSFCFLNKQSPHKNIRHAGTIQSVCSTRNLQKKRKESPFFSFLENSFFYVKKKPSRVHEIITKAERSFILQKEKGSRGTGGSTLMEN